MHDGWMDGMFCAHLMNTLGKYLYMRSHSLNTLTLSIVFSVCDTSAAAADDDAAVLLLPMMRLLYAKRSYRAVHSLARGAQ